VVCTVGRVPEWQGRQNFFLRSTDLYFVKYPASQHRQLAIVICLDVFSSYIILLKAIEGRLNTDKVTVLFEQTFKDAHRAPAKLQ